MPALYSCIIGFVEYYTTLDGEPHYMGFIVDVRTIGRPAAYVAEKKREPSVIWVDEPSPISTGEIALQKSIIYRSYAD
jgi:hypothetical protein